MECKSKALISLENIAKPIEGANFPSLSTKTGLR